jgi:hypothetical protein
VTQRSRGHSSRRDDPALLGPVALVVGTLLLAVNQGSDLSSGDLDLGTALRGLANYLIPYVVSSIGYLKGTNGPGRSEVEEAAL